MYEAMARRYRPRTFDDVIGQEHVAQTLKNAIATERVAHAYLFCGPHGCGKTSMARIFACALVCEKGPTSTPCGECAICRDVLRGQDLDVQEIDGASNNGVEQVRALREQAGYIPTRARYKVYIIDEVHMLSVAAFNALLKTLEEPPAHVKFILATTDPHKILGTILSRCQRFDFRLVPPPRLAEFFKKLVAQENAEITDDALDAVAAFSGGSVRDGLVLLDQLLSYAQGKVTREDVERVRGVAGAEAVAGIYEAVLSHDVKRALQIVDEVAQRGTNVGDFLDQLIEYGRDLMLVSATGAQDGVTAYGPARKILLELASAMTLDQALLMLDVFAQARTRVRSRALTNPLVPLEMAVARLAGLETLEPMGKMIARLEAYASGAPLPAPGRPAPIANPSNVTPAVSTASAPSVTVAAAQTVSAATAPVASAAVAAVPVASATPAEQNTQAAPVVRDMNPAPSTSNPVVNESASASASASAPATEDRPPWEEAPAASANPTSNTAEVAANSQPVASAQNSAPAAQEPADSASAEDSAESGESGGYFVEEDDEPESTEPFDAALTKSVEASNIGKTPAQLWDEIRATLPATDLGMLADVQVGSLTSDVLYLTIPPDTSFFAERIKDGVCRKRMEEAALQVLGRPVRVELVQLKASAPAAPRVSPALERQNVGRDPGIRLLLERFDGTIVNVEEGR